MRYENGKLITAAGVVIPLNVPAAALLHAIDPNFGTYQYIDLVTGDAKLAGKTGGHTHPQANVLAFSGQDVAIAAMPETIADEAAVVSGASGLSAPSYREQIIGVITGNLDATAGVTTVLDDGSSLFIKSPLPAIALGASTTIMLPTMTHMIGVTGIAVLTNANVVTAIGAGNGLGTGVSWEKFGPGLVIIADGTVVTAGGYVAVNFIP